jgi:hypothetical protein
MLGATEEELPAVCKAEDVWVWERHPDDWKVYEPDVQRLLNAANAREGTHAIHTNINGYSYEISPKEGTQINQQTGCVRRINLFSNCSFPSSRSQNTEQEPANVKTLANFKTLQIQIMTLTGDCIELSVKDSDTILQVKRALGRIEGTSHYQQSLWKTDDEDPDEEPAPLRNLKTVAQCGLKDGELLTLLVGDRLGLGAILTDIETFRCEKKLKSVHVRGIDGVDQRLGGGVRRALGMGAAAVERARMVGRLDPEQRDAAHPGDVRGGLLAAIRARALGEALRQQ